MCFKASRLARYTIFINSVSRTGEHLRGLRLANGNVLFGFREQNLARPQTAYKPRLKKFWRNRNTKETILPTKSA